MNDGTILQYSKEYPKRDVAVVGLRDLDGNILLLRTHKLPDFWQPVGGDVKGTVVSSRGDNGFGFDQTFIPDGQGSTYAEMSAEQKDNVSHRSAAIKLFVNELRSR